MKHIIHDWGNDPRLRCAITRLQERPENREQQMLQSDRWRSLGLAAVAAIVLSSGIGVVLAAWAGQEPTLETVLARAAAYVTDYRERLSGIVSEEQYEQRARTPGRDNRGVFDYDDERIELRSDFLLVKPEGQDGFVEFRDVFEVNGLAVRDRQDRLTELFLNPSATAARQIAQIAVESARYNVGDVVRTLNTPTLALLLLQPTFQPRFAFSPTNDRSPTLDLDLDEVDALSDAIAIRVIAFREVSRETVISGEAGKRLPATGRFWIDAETGRVLLSEFIIEDPGVIRALIDVRYADDAELGHLMPVEMRELYNDLRDGARVEGTATYTRFRRFQVQVDETSPRGE